MTSSCWWIRVILMPWVSFPSIIFENFTQSNSPTAAWIYPNTHFLKDPLIIFSSIECTLASFKPRGSSDVRNIIIFSYLPECCEYLEQKYCSLLKFNPPGFLLTKFLLKTTHGTTPSSPASFSNFGRTCLLLVPAMEASYRQQWQRSILQYSVRNKHLYRTIN